MPTISRFYGILIRMYFADHAPPHFHAMYAEHEAVIGIQTFDVLRGQLPPRALALVIEWAQLNQQALMEDWNLCVQNQQPKSIRPLQ